MGKGHGAITWNFSITLQLAPQFWKKSLTTLKICIPGQKISIKIKKIPVLYILIYINCNKIICISQLRFSFYTVQLKGKTQSPRLFKDYRNAELTRSPCVYMDGPRNNMDMTDGTRCLHEAITDCNHWNLHS